MSIKAKNKSEEGRPELSDLEAYVTNSISKVDYKISYDDFKAGIHLTLINR